MQIGAFTPLKGEQRVDEFAARIIVETNSCFRLLLNDDGSADGLVDYLIVERGADVGALEVGRNTDPAAKANYAAWARVANNPPTFAGLRWWWSICCKASSKFKRLEENIAPILLDMESAGVSRAGRDEPDSWRPESYTARLFAKGVVSATVFDRDRNPGRIDVRASGGRVADAGIQPLVDEHARWLGSDAPDQLGLLRKLEIHSELPHRQAFVWVDGQSPFVAWHALGEDLSRANGPTLPSPLTGVWIADSARGWGWSADRGWFKLEHVPAALSHARALLA